MSQLFITEKGRDVPGYFSVCYFPGFKDKRIIRPEKRFLVFSYSGL
jgi:hypothetical protein